MRFLLWLCALAAPAGAHDPGLSSSRLTIGGQQVRATLAFAGADLALLAPSADARDATSDRTSDGTSERGALRALVERGLAVAVDGRAAALTAFASHRADNGDVVIELAFARPAGIASATPGEASGEQLTVDFALLRDLARGHRHWAVIEDEAGARLGEALLSAAAPALTAALRGKDPAPLAENPAQLARARAFLGLGVEHILAGYDHLLFLLALLAAGGGLRAAVKVITAFTAAHSLTLAGAALGLVHLPGTLVEAVIAASIAYVGLENLLRRDLGRRWLCAFAFGLVHGFGFASVLAELGIGAGAAAVVPLLAFNLGVEAGQLAVAALALPVLGWLQRRPVLGARVRPALSAVVVAAGVYWLLERTLL